MSFTKFVLLSQARSGTSLVTSTLNAHPKACCHGEIFHQKNPRAHVKEEWHETHDFDAVSSGDPVAFAMSVLAETGAAGQFDAVGFKMWRGQNEAACDAVCADETIKKVILQRENRLASFSSGVLARTTGVWNLPKDAIAKAEKPKIEFNKKAFLRYTATQDALFEKYGADAQGDTLQLTYQTLNAETFKTLQEFLGLEVLSLEAGKTKLHGSNIVERFKPEVQAEIIATLEEIGHPEWQVETIQ